MLLTYNNHNIEQRDLDNYVNLTEMSKANGKELKDFNRSEFAKKYVKALVESKGADFTPLITTGFGSEKTTWAHPLVAIAYFLF